MQSKWQRVGQRVSSAKRWLAKAEEEFSRERPARGELNLMLAEAELKRLKESEPAVRRSWLRHGAALAAAVIMTGVVSGAWWFLRAPAGQGVQPPANPSVLTTEFAPPLAAKAASISATLSVPQQPTPVVEKTAVLSDNLAKQEVVARRQPEKEPASDRQPVANIGMNQDEMRQLVRKAGQTLRGQQQRGL